MEKKLETLFRDFEYHPREAVNAVQDARAQRVPKDAERRISKLRRDSASIPFDRVPTRPAPTRTIPRQPRSKHAEATTVKLNPWACWCSQKKSDDNHFEVESAR